MHFQGLAELHGQLSCSFKERGRRRRRRPRMKCRLPDLPPHTAFRESPERRAEGSRRPVRILLVEDDDDVRLLLTLVLKRAGYRRQRHGERRPGAPGSASRAPRPGPHRLLPAEERRTGVPGGSALRRRAGRRACHPVHRLSTEPPLRRHRSGEAHRPRRALLQQIRAALKR